MSIPSEQLFPSNPVHLQSHEAELSPFGRQTPLFSQIPGGLSLRRLLQRLRSQTFPGLTKDLILGIS